MKRRTVLGATAGSALAGLAGCLSAGGRSTDSETTTEAPTTTEPGTTPEDRTGEIEYLVRNDSEETVPLSVTIEDPDGSVVHEKADESFEPGEQLEGSYAAPDGDAGPYPVTIALESLSQTVEWKPQECAPFDLLYAVTEPGGLEAEREYCNK